MPKDKTEDVVFEYMKSQNRPYSALDIHSNLHKAEGKTAIVRALESLTSEGKLLEKCYGKTKIYVVHQSLFPDIKEAEINKMDEDIKTLNETLNTGKIKQKQLTTELNALMSSMTTETARSTVSELQAEILNLSEKCQLLKKSAKNFDSSKKNDIVKNRTVMLNTWRKRKRLANDMTNAILEGYPKSKKQFYEEVGIETDEECGVIVPSS